MGLLLILVSGLVVGAIARAIVGSRQDMSLPTTIGVGALGSFVGGAVGSLLAGRSLLEINPAGLIGGALGALAVLCATGATGDRRLTA